MGKIENEALKIFENRFDDWKAFIELAKMKDQLIDIWYDRFFQDKHDVIPHGWKLIKVKNREYCWCLENESKESFSIWLEHDCISIWADLTKYNISKIKDYLKALPDLNLRTYFKDKIVDSGGYFIRENVGGILDNKSVISVEELAWYLGNESEQLKKNLIEKLKFFDLLDGSSSLFKLINDNADFRL